MDIIDKLNSLYTVKFTENYDLLNRGDRKYFIFTTFDDKRYLFKQYKKNTSNLTKLKDSNLVSHAFCKRINSISDYIISKEFDPIVEISEEYVGTLYNYNEGIFINTLENNENIFTLLTAFSEEFHRIGSEIISESFSINQIEKVNTIIEKRIDYIKEEIEDKGIHYLLENKFSLKFDTDILELNLSHILNGLKITEEIEPVILNMDFNLDNITFSNNLEGITNVYFDRVYIGHPYFEIAKTISRLSVHQNINFTKEHKKKFLKEIKEPHYLQDNFVDTLIVFNLVDMFFKYLKTEDFRENDERFTVLKNRLIKEKILLFT